MKKYSQVGAVVVLIALLCAWPAQAADAVNNQPDQNSAAPAAVEQPALAAPCPPALEATPLPGANPVPIPGSGPCPPEGIGPSTMPTNPRLPVPDMTTPITLDQALELAFVYSPSLRIAVDQIQRARAVVAEARANFNPRFNAQLTYLRQNETTATIPAGPGEPSQKFTVRSGSDMNAAVNALLPLDINRSLSYAEDIAKYQFQIEYLNLVAQSELLILDVQRAYYDLLRACGQRDVAQAAVEVAQVRLANTQARFEAGTVPRFDVTSAEVDVANLNQQLIQAENRVLVAQAALNNVIGINPDTPTRVVDIEIAAEPTKLDVSRWIEVALDRRPELRSAQTAILLNQRVVNLRRTEYYPSLSVSANTGYLFETTGFNTQNVNWQVSLNLNIPIWNGGITRAQVNQARADVQRAEDVLDQSELQIALEVRVAATTLEEAATRVQTTARNVALAEEALRLANVRYEAGIATPVEVTNAEAQLTEARFNNVNAKYDFAVALAQLRRATSTQSELERVQLLETTPTL